MSKVTAPPRNTQPHSRPPIWDYNAIQCTSVGFALYYDPNSGRGETPEGTVDALKALT